MLLKILFMEHNRYILVNNKQHNWYIKSTNNVSTNEDSIVKSITIHQLVNLFSSFYMHINQILIAKQQASGLIMIDVKYVIIIFRQISVFRSYAVSQ